MKGFLQEYGVIMVVVAVVLGMLTFGKTGYAKGIQDAILGSADHIVETGENITKKEVKVSDIIEIDDWKYVVLEQKDNNQTLIMRISNSPYYSRHNFQTDYVRDFREDNYGLRPDGQNASTYENSEIDNYLEGTWYRRLSTKMQAAIQTTNIKQASYKDRNPDLKSETGPRGQIYNTINRHVFLPSVEEISKVVDLKNPEKMEEFLVDESIWTRDSGPNPDNVIILSKRYNMLNYGDPDDICAEYYVRPAFVIDLSQVDYKVVGHTDYK